MVSGGENRTGTQVTNTTANTGTTSTGNTSKTSGHSTIGPLVTIESAARKSPGSPQRASPVRVHPAEEGTLHGDEYPSGLVIRQPVLEHESHHHYDEDVAALPPRTPSVSPVKSRQGTGALLQGPTVVRKVTGSLCLDTCAQSSSCDYTCCGCFASCCPCCLPPEIFVESHDPGMLVSQGKLGARCLRRWLVCLDLRIFCSWFWICNDVCAAGIRSGMSAPVENETPEELKRRQEFEDNAVLEEAETLQTSAWMRALCCRLQLHFSDADTEQVFQMVWLQDAYAGFQRFVGLLVVLLLAELIAALPAARPTEGVILVSMAVAAIGIAVLARSTFHQDILPETNDEVDVSRLLRDARRKRKAQEAKIRS